MPFPLPNMLFLALLPRQILFILQIAFQGLRPQEGFLDFFRQGSYMSDSPFFVLTALWTLLSKVPVTVWFSLSLCEE